MKTLKKRKIVHSTVEQRKNDPITAEIAEALGISDVTAQILVNRGYTDVASARAFLKKSKEILHDPFLLPDMEAGVSRTLAAMRAHERITVYGDYDVDGVTSTSCLYLYLQALGCDVNYYIPNRRTDGYGMSMSSVKKIADGGTKLIITVDNGITAMDEIAYAKKCGMDVVVTDHHECRETLPECPVIDPHRGDSAYPFAGLAGVGVVFKFLCALEIRLHPERDVATNVGEIAMRYGDMVGMGTVADVMPLRDENRLIVAYGLSLIEQGRRPGMAALVAQMNADGKKDATRRVTATTIGYNLGPRVNAAGRLDDASVAVSLMIAPTVEAARPIASRLSELNKERQRIDNEISTDVDRKIGPIPPPPGSFIVLADDNWDPGVVGNVASHVTEKYSCPSLLITFAKEKGEPISDEDEGKGSARSVPGLNLSDAFNACDDILVHHGGHASAAGLTVQRKHFPELVRRLKEYAETHLDKNNCIPTFDVDCELAPNELTLEIAEELMLLEPCGTDNPTPVFCVSHLRIVEAREVGGGKHFSMTFASGDTTVKGIWYGVSAKDVDVSTGDTVDAVFDLTVNEFRGQRSPQLTIRELVADGALEARREAQRARYRDHENGTNFGDPTEVIPTRDDCARLYRLLKRELGDGEVMLSLWNILRFPEIDFGYAKLKYILRAFLELGLAKGQEADDDRVVLRLDSGVHADLSSSKVLGQLLKRYERKSV